MTGGDTVALRGSGFEPGMSVTFDGTRSPKVTVTAHDQATAITPAHSVGPAVLAVINPGGKTRGLSLSDFFFFDPSVDPCLGCWDYGASAARRKR